MQKDLQNRPQFLMITDTAMVRKGGKVYAFGPVVLELEVFRKLFGTVAWIGFERPDRVDDPTMMEVPEWVDCVLIKKCGGDSWKEKLQVIGRAPFMLSTITGYLLRHDVIHTRAPSSPAFLGALLSFFFKKKIWWHKYAGNWAQDPLPFFYGLQRWFLSKCYWAKVTINGRWPGQPAHCLSFENPCLTKSDREQGQAVLKGKSYVAPWEFCFVGRLERAKGVQRILDALAAYPQPGQIKAVHLVGDGPERRSFEAQARSLTIPVHFHGFLPREEVFRIYARSHFFLLPSDSEGFPKVIAEAANFGCIPLVSDVSSIPHYVQHEKNGFVWEAEGKDFSVFFARTLNDVEKGQLRSIATVAFKMAGLFTFERYGERIVKEILDEG